jgi:hypothetical protein
MNLVGIVLQPTVAVITGLAAIAGIIGLAAQLRRLRRTAESQVYQGLIANALKLDELMIANPKLRKYICDGAAVPPIDFDEPELESMIEFVVNVIDSFKVQEKYIPDHARNGWRAFERDVMKQPAVAHFMAKRGHWYAGTLYDDDTDSK